MNKRLDVLYKLLVEGSKAFNLDKPTMDERNSQIGFCGNIIKIWECGIIVNSFSFFDPIDAACFIVSETLNSKVLHFFGESS